ncbi:MAG: hypothetical protein LBC79_05335 [Deltaproteobacteria bacterium]|jgi:hypothetical protein|nr:hypothetical protein [Deltaproteobacteria bacterium]
MKPFYQGKLDVFCAVYAVLNGLRLTHGLRALKARDIFHETLLALAENKGAFKAVLDQQTDYIPLVDAMLQVHSINYPLRVQAPFPQPEENGSDPGPEATWQAIHGWLDGSLHRAAIFRFFRYLQPEEPPVNRHWSTISHLEDGSLRLYDASHEPEAVQRIGEHEFVTNTADIRQGRLIYLDPHSLRFIAKR